jgi:hypothetical protein
MNDTTAGFSLFTIALGAILKFAVTARTRRHQALNRRVILMVVGAIGLVVSLWPYLARHGR